MMRKMTRLLEAHTKETEEEIFFAPEQLQGFNHRCIALSSETKTLPQ